MVLQFSVLIHILKLRHENGKRASTGCLHQPKAFQDRGIVQLSHWIRVKVYLVQWSEPKGGQQPTDVRNYSRDILLDGKLADKLAQSKRVLGQF